MGAQVTIATHLLNGRRVGNVVDPKSLDNNATIQEAIDYGYAMGKIDQIGYNAKGVLKSMVNGISKDGNGRKIDEFFSIQPSIQGRLNDVTDDISKDKISVVAHARTLKNLKLDTSDWTVTLEGTTGDLTINSISTGETTGVVVVGEDVDINGFGFKLSTGDTVKWSVLGTAKSGTVAAEKLTDEMTRLTIAGEALSELNSAEYDGKTIVFTLSIGNNRGVKSAVLKVE